MAGETERVARCACGQLRVRVSGEPDVVTMCHCTECQRRTGSPFGIGAYFRHEMVGGIDGQSKTFRRGVEGTDRTLTNHFCGDCGTTVFWTLDLRPGHKGIAVGCFAEPEFVRPARTVWTQHMHHWVTLPADLPAFPKAAT